MEENDQDRIKRLQDKMAEARAAMRDRMGKHLASIGGDSKYAFSQNHSGSWTPTGFDAPIQSDNIHVTTNHNLSDGTIRFTLGTDIPNPKHEKSPQYTQPENTRVHLGTGIIYPDGRIDMLPKPAWTHTADGSMDERAIKFILSDHLKSPVRHPKTGEIITVGAHHGLNSEIQESLLFEKWTQKYKKSIDCSNPKGFSQRAHCQGRKKRLHEDLRRWFKEKWTAQSGEECGSYSGRGRVKCRPSKRVSEKSPQTWGEMSGEEKKKAVRLKQKAHREGKQWSSHKSGKTWDGPKNKYKPGKKKMDESYLVEDDVIHTGETPVEYRTRLLRTINSGDFESMDHHDRVHGYSVFIDSIKHEYPNRSMPPLIVRVLDSTGAPHARALRVTGVTGKSSNATLIGVPASAGGHRSYHGTEETQRARDVTGVMTSNIAFMKPEHIRTIRQIVDFSGKRKRGLREVYEQIINKILTERKTKKSDCGCETDIQEAKEKKPYKGFKKGKNHPEGGLSRAEAKRQGIHAGIETKDEAKRKGGFGKLSKKTQKRRKSFCARMCGMKKRRTSSKTARDPKSKINAALRVWGCRCSTNESYEPQTTMLTEANIPTDSKLWSRAKSLAKKKFKVYPSAYANGWAAKWYKKHGGGWKKGKKSMKESRELLIKLIAEEVVNKRHKGSMTPKEIVERDRIAKSVKGIRPIKGKDSLKNAKYRYATYVVLRKRKGEEGESESPKKSKKKKD